MELEEKIEFWVDHSIYDFKTARSMQRSGRYVYAVFMCQQAIEKYIKAIYLKTHGKEAPKSHNLLYLLEQIGLDISEEDRNFLAQLSSYYISGRYPTYKIKISKLLNRKMAKNYLKKSGEFLKWIKKRLAG
jgi:HEPN domain-containing protein